MNESIYVCNDYLGVVSMHRTKIEGLEYARQLLNQDPEIKELFVCDWLKRFKPLKLES